MAKLGYHFSHEQFAPSQLLKWATKVDEAGFKFGLSSDHFHPWNTNQDQSGFAWSWLGAALAQTKLELGVVNCPCYRYHPAIIAQAAATLDEMFPGRFYICLGSGQAMNEAITGLHWPAKEERNQRLQESAEIIRELWDGDTVTRNGSIKIEEATLYTRPRQKTPMIGAAITPETAAWLAGWADGLITVSQPLDKLRKVVDAWNSNGGVGKPMLLKVQLSYHKDENEALWGAHEQWKTNIFGSAMLAELRTPKQFEQAAAHVKPDELREHVNISSDTSQHLDWLKQYADLGFKKLVLHNVNTSQEQFIEAFAEKVLPEFSAE